MVRLIKAHDKPNGIVFELSTTATNKRSARTKATMSLLGRRPGKATAVDDVVVTELGSGVFKHYRVEILIKDGRDIKSILRLDDAMKSIEGIL